MAAEGLGLAASVAGLVSLGLQITGGIVKYVDAFKGRREELEFVRRQNESLTATLQAFEGLRTSTTALSAEVEAAAASNMKLFESELNSIKALHDELAGDDDRSLAKRMENKKKRLTYAFSKAKVQELGDRLEKASKALQLTMSVMGLQTLRQNTDTIAGISSEIAAVATPILNINHQLRSLHSGIEANSQLAASQYCSLSVQVRQSSEDVLRTFQGTNDILQNLVQLTSRLEQQRKREQELNERLAGLLGHVQQKAPRHAARAAAFQLANEPMFLKEASDKLLPSLRKHERTAPPSIHLPSVATSIQTSALRPHDQPGTWRGCICPRPHRVRERRRTFFGDSVFSEQETSTHWPSCPMGRTTTGKQRVTLNFKFKGLSRILKTAIDVSFTLTSGAGGFSISPAFTCRPTVDAESDPAFLILDLCGDACLRLCNKSREPFIRACLVRLAWLFENGKAWPTATNDENESLMHRAMLTIDLLFSYPYESFGMSVLFAEMIDLLRSYGADVFAYDVNGHSPVITLLELREDLEVIQPLLHALMQTNIESQPIISSDCSTPIIGYAFYRLTAIKPLYRTSLSFAEACGCGPLSIAIIRNDIDQVMFLTQSNPGLLSERDIYNQSPLHLAADNRSILDILLKVAESSLLEHRDQSGLTALETAMVYTSEYCINRNGIERCKQKYCGCCQCVDLFLNAGSNVRMRKTDRCDSQLGVILGSASELARRKYVLFMKYRWESEMRIRLSEPVVPTNPCHFESRRDSKPTMTGRNRNTKWPYQSGDSTSSDVASEMGWMFNEVSVTHLAALFYRHGFRPHFSCLNQISFSNTMNLPYLHWLISHGVTPWFRSLNGPALVEGSPNTGLFGAHLAFDRLGLYCKCYQYLRPPDNGFIGDRAFCPNRPPLLVDLTIPWRTFTDLVATASHYNITDGCQCHCTVEGCSPFTWMMKSRGYKSSWGPKWPLEEYIIHDFVSHYNQCSAELAALTHKAAIRFATFAKLGLRHTCCDPRDMVYRGKWTVRDLEEVDIVNEEQDRLLRKLEELVAEFEEKATEYIKTDLDGQSAFSQFWPDYWAVRMEEELRELEGNQLTAVERRAAEDIGVRWETEVTQKETKTKNPYDEKDAKHWFWELDKICPEYNGPRPEGLTRVSELS